MINAIDKSNLINKRTSDVIFEDVAANNCYRKVRKSACNISFLLFTFDKCDRNYILWLNAGHSNKKFCPNCQNCL